MNRLWNVHSLGEDLVAEIRRQSPVGNHIHRAFDELLEIVFQADQIKKRAAVSSERVLPGLSNAFAIGCKAGRLSRVMDS